MLTIAGIYCRPVFLFYEGRGASGDVSHLEYQSL